MRNSSQLLVSFAVSTVALLFGVYLLFGVNLAKWQTVKETRIRLAERQMVMDQLTDLINKFRERVVSFDNLNNQITLVDTALPSSLSVPELLVSIEAIAFEGQANLDSITFTSVQTSQASQAAKDPKKVKTVEPLSMQINISGSGNYKAVKDFVIGLEQELRLVDIRGISFRSAAVLLGGGSGKNTPTAEDFGAVFNFQISADTYYIEKPSFTLP
jgi:hypothetical protein